MAKRAATTQMTHDNWDHEDDEPEAPGEFAAASTDELAQRKIRVAKRRIAGQDSGKTAGGSIFGSFAGFGTKTTPASINAPMSFNLPTAPLFGTGLPSLSATGKPAMPNLFSGTSASTPVSNKLPDFVVQPSKPAVESIFSSFGAKKTPTSVDAPVSDGSKGTKTADTKSEYFADLKALNEGVITWMQENFQENPFVNFTPVFSDYKTHFKQLEEKHNIQSQPTAKDNGAKEPIIGRTTNINEPTITNGTPSIPAPQPFKFGLSSSVPSVPPVVPTITVSTDQDPKPFSFGIPQTKAPTLTTSASVPTFAFGGGGGYSSTPFSFGQKQPTTDKFAETDEKDAANGGEEEGEYEPPKPERVDQVEEDAFYNVRCKLFYKKADKFVEKGVGTLSLKPLAGGKTQLLIRADTATGNILLNLSLNESMPCSRNGKNNVTLVCVPNPPLDPKSPTNEPAVLLIRVKTAEDADQLLQEIDTAKSSA